MADADFTFNPNIAITPDHQIDLSGTVDPGVRKLQIFDQSGGVLNLTVKPDGTWSGSESYNPNVSTAYSYKAEYNDASGQAQTTLDPTGVTVGLPFTFNPDITFTPDNKMVLTGTVDPGGSEFANSRSKWRCSRYHHQAGRNVVRYLCS